MLLGARRISLGAVRLRHQLPNRTCQGGNVSTSGQRSEGRRARPGRAKSPSEAEGRASGSIEGTASGTAWISGEASTSASFHFAIAHVTLVAVISSCKQALRMGDTNMKPVIVGGAGRFGVPVVALPQAQGHWRAAQSPERTA
ncbi:hypothetical protein [Novosphingobium sp. LASN5T]|uniref:hypothetical protein n=1 Tax=Novosphingobium sp. LASN5T TaxID=2491021 RepID=UPI000F5E9E56|nr:hypothetical protein [Novosphingobium sp. LASN5T]MBF5092685.1 hypothetical protein [Novosphingobium sp. NBM11]